MDPNTVYEFMESMKTDLEAHTQLICELRDLLARREEDLKRDLERKYVGSPEFVAQLDGAFERARMEGHAKGRAEVLAGAVKKAVSRGPAQPHVIVPLPLVARKKSVSPVAGEAPPKKRLTISPSSSCPRSGQEETDAK